MLPFLLPLIFASTLAIDKEHQCSLLDGRWVNDPLISCLIINKRGGGFSSSKKFCQAKGGHLAHIKDETILNKTKPYLQEPEHIYSGYWIGLEASAPGENLRSGNWNWVGAEGDPLQSFGGQSMLDNSCCGDDNMQAYLSGGSNTGEQFKFNNNLNQTRLLPPFCQYPRGLDHCRLVSCMNGGSCEQNETRATCICPDGVSGDNCEVPEANCMVAYGEPQFQDIADMGYEHLREGMAVILFEEKLYPGTLLGWRISAGIDTNLDNEVELMLWKAMATADDFQVVFKQTVKVYELNLDGPTWIPAARNVTIDGQTLMGFHYPKAMVLANAGPKVTSSKPKRYGIFNRKLNESDVLTMNTEWYLYRKFAFEMIMASDNPELLCACSECLNGGTCVESVDQPWTCNCSPGFTGRDCSIDINECESNPCGDHGDCIDKVNGYECVCKENYMGAHCSCRRYTDEKFQLKKKDAYLVGAMGQSTTERNHVICAFRCSAVGWCQSFDFVHKNGTCLLNQKKTGDLQDALGIDHYVRGIECP